MPAGSIRPECPLGSSVICEILSYEIPAADAVEKRDYRYLARVVLK